MITLVANTKAKLIKAENRLRYMIITSDSTTITRIAHTETGLEMSGNGFAMTAYESVIVRVTPNTELFAVSTATPNISISEVINPVDIIVLE